MLGRFTLPAVTSRCRAAKERAVRWSNDDPCYQRHDNTRVFIRADRHFSRAL